MTTETALPTDEPIVAAGEQATPDAAATEGQGEQVEGQEKPEGEEPAKKEKTPEQRDRDKLVRRVDSKTRQVYQLRAELEQLRASLPKQTQQQSTPANDDEPVTLSRAELERHIEERAAQRAPSIAEQRAEIERRNGIVKTLAKEWSGPPQDEGGEFATRYDEVAAELTAVFGGLLDAQGRPKPATDAIFDADNPKAVIEYLTDPDNADEAERIARLPAARAGKEITLLELKLKEEAAKAKPKPSNAPKPLEPVKGGGVSTKDPADMTDREFAAWRRAQIAKRN